MIKCIEVALMKKPRYIAFIDYFTLCLNHRCNTMHSSLIYGSSWDFWEGSLWRAFVSIFNITQELKNYRHSIVLLYFTMGLSVLQVVSCDKISLLSNVISITGKSRFNQIVTTSTSTSGDSSQLLYSSAKYQLNRPMGLHTNGPRNCVLQCPMEQCLKYACIQHDFVAINNFFVCSIRSKPNWAWNFNAVMKYPLSNPKV